MIKNKDINVQNKDFTNVQDLKTIKQTKGL